MNLKKIIALILTLLLLCSTFVGCRKMGETQYGSYLSTDSNINVTYDNVDIIDENESELESIIDETLETTDETQPGDSGNDSSTGNTTNNDGDSGNDDSDNPQAAPEIPDAPTVDTGNGNSAETAYEGYLSEDGTFLTHEIPAGKSLFYNIRGAGRKILTINSANAYVVFNNETHTAKDGKVSFFLETDAQPNEFVLIEFGNSGTAPESFSVVFMAEQGTIDAPVQISSIDESIKRHLEDDNSEGYVYQYSVKKDGTLRFYLLSGTEKGQMMITNLRDSATRSTESIEEGEVKSDSIGTYIEVQVKKGDKVRITIGIKPNKRNQYKATDIEFLIKYA